MHQIIEKLNWRYAVKKYDPSQKVDQKDLLLIQEAIRLSASSYGLQPYRVLIITDEAIRGELRKVSFDQSQITDASHLAVFAIENEVNDAYIEKYFERLLKARNIKMEGDLLHYKNSLMKRFAGMSDAQKTNWATNQAYIALGHLLIAASELGIDANPMEGFNAGQYNQILGLNPKGLSSVVIAGIGYRHSDDFFQHLKKTRKTPEELFITI